jgi:excisionase family DNA binding protein
METHGKQEQNGENQMKWYTYKQVAELLQVSIQTVRHWMRNGQLSVNRISHRTVRISQESLDSFMEQSGRNHETKV